MHRDLKPSNIMFSNYNNLNSLKLIDFGQAYKFSSILDCSPIGLCGTYPYMAPEQIINAKCTKVLIIRWQICGHAE